MVTKWKIGDLVKILTPGWEPLFDSYAAFSAGIVVDIELDENGDQQFLFPAISVYEFKSHAIRRYSPSHLEVLSGSK